MNEDEIRRRTEDWSDKHREKFAKQFNQQMKGRGARSKALAHAAEQLRRIKADPRSTTYDKLCARERVEIAASDPSRYWAAWSDWSDWRAAFQRENQDE